MKQGQELLRNASLQSEKRTKSIQNIDSLLAQEEMMLAKLERNQSELSKKSSELSFDDMNNQKMNLRQKIQRNRKKRKTIQQINKIDRQLTKLKYNKKLKEAKEDSDIDFQAKWSTQQKMYAMTENYFGVALFLIFRLFKTYNNMFWVSIMLHSLVKIAYSMTRIFRITSRFSQVVNGLVVGGEICRYMLYLVMLLWTRETEVDQLLQDKKYGSWMVWLLLWELFFHLVGFMMTIVFDCRYRVKKFKEWQKKRNAKEIKKTKPKKKASAKLFVNKKSKLMKKKSIIFKAYSSVGSENSLSKVSQKIKKKFIKKAEPNEDLNRSIDDIQDYEFKLKSSSSKMTNPYDTKYDYEKINEKEKNKGDEVKIFDFMIKKAQNSQPKTKSQNLHAGIFRNKEQSKVENEEHEDDAKIDMEHPGNLPDIYRKTKKQNSVAWRIKPREQPMLNKVLQGDKFNSIKSITKTAQTAAMTQKTISQPTGSEKGDIDSVNASKKKIPHQEALYDSTEGINKEEMKPLKDLAKNSVKAHDYNDIIKQEQDLFNQELGLFVNSLNPIKKKKIPPNKSQKKGSESEKKTEPKHLLTNVVSSQRRIERKKDTIAAIDAAFNFTDYNIELEHPNKTPVSDIIQDKVKGESNGQEQLGGSQVNPPPPVQLEFN